MLTETEFRALSAARNMIIPEKSKNLLTMSREYATIIHMIPKETLSELLKLTKSAERFFLKIPLYLMRANALPKKL